MVLHKLHLGALCDTKLPVLAVFSLLMTKLLCLCDTL